jgi:NAD(P)H dehydrogenase (quinone)
MNVLVVFGHPDATASFNAHLLERAVAVLSAKHTVRVLDLHSSGFQPKLDERELRAQLAGDALPDELASHVELLRWCSGLVFVYPTMWSGPPAMVKGWFDRVWVRGVAYDVTESGRLRGLLTNIRRVAVVTTHGSSKIVNLAEGETGKRLLQRSIGPLCRRFRPVSWISMYTIDRSTNEQRVAFVQKVERRLARW